jgi:hypothetical protein
LKSLESISRLLQRAPLNTDYALLGVPFTGYGRAVFFLGAVMNITVLAALIYVIAKKEADYTYFIYVYFGVLVGSHLLSLLLTPILRGGSLFAIIAFVVVLLMKFCMISFKRAVFIAVAYQAFQIAYIIVWRSLATEFSGR